MGRSYAAVLGSLAFTFVTVRGVLAGAAAESTLRYACLYLMAFAVIGGLVGSVAESILVDALHRRFQEEMDSLDREGRLES